MQDQQRRQQRVEDVVRGEHLHDLRGLYRRAEGIKRFHVTDMVEMEKE